jgi:hypothetical protein
MTRLASRRQRSRAPIASGSAKAAARSPVDIAERDDPRQDHGFAVEGFEERVAQQPSGAPRRQIKRCCRKDERIGGRRDVEPAVHHRHDEGAQEWGRRRNGEDARGHQVSLRAAALA